MAETETKAAIDAFERASRKVKQCLGLKSGGAGAETDYSVAYQGLVRANLAPQLRGKYR